MFISAASILIPINNKNNYSNHNNNYTNNKMRHKHQTWNNAAFDNNNLFYGYDRKDTKLNNDTNQMAIIFDVVDDVGIGQARKIV